jgi:hypothetical protein
MTEPQSALPPPRPPFQFTLRTLLLLFVVLGSSLAVFGAWGIAVFGVVVGLAIHARTTSNLKVLGCLMIVVVCSVLLLGVAWAWLLSMRNLVYAFGPPHGLSCKHNMKQIAFALQLYHSAHNCFPPAIVADKTGKPTASWRGLIVPYLDNDGEYQNLTKIVASGATWNSLSTMRIADFLCPSDHSELIGPTSYLAVVGPDTAWSGDKPRNIEEFGKDASDTVMVVEVHDNCVCWAEPKDIALQSIGTPVFPRSRFLLPSNHDGRDDFFFVYDPGISVVMADGKVRCLDLREGSADELQRIFRIGGCKGIDEAGRHLNWPNIAALLVWLLSVGTLLVGAVRGRKARLGPRRPLDRGRFGGGATHGQGTCLS